MIAIKNLKLNELQQVDIPRPRDLMKLTGLREPNPQQYTGDDTLATSLNKVDAAQAAMEVARRDAEAAEEKE